MVNGELKGSTKIRQTYFWMEKIGKIILFIVSMSATHRKSLKVSGIPSNGKYICILCFFVQQQTDGMIFHRKTLARHDNKCSLKIDRFFFLMPFIFWIDNCHNDWNQMNVIVVLLFWLKVQTHPNDFYSFAIVQRHINSVSSILYWWTITNKAINFDGCSDFCPFRANIDPFRKIMMLKNWEMHSTAMDLAKIFTKRNIEDESRRKRRAESETLQSQAFTQIVALVCLDWKFMLNCLFAWIAHCSCNFRLLSLPQIKYEKFKRASHSKRLWIDEVQRNEGHHPLFLSTMLSYQMLLCHAWNLNLFRKKINKIHFIVICSVCSKNQICWNFM